MTTNEVAVVADAMPDKRALEVMIARRELIQKAIGSVMVDGHHFGAIPGAGTKKVLLKPGAECLCNLFQLTPTFDQQIRELPNDHREIRMTCTLTHRGSGAVVASANGSCSTMESKYRWRLGSRKCPGCGAEAIRKGSKGFFCGTKLGGCGANFAADARAILDQPEARRAENPDITDAHHTVMMMAQKRALVAATRLALAASDLFMDEERTEDDDREEEQPHRGQQRQQRREQPVEDYGEPGAGSTQLDKRQEAMRDVIGLREALVKKGRTQQGLHDLLSGQGIKVPAKLGDADEDTMLRMRAVLQKEFAAMGGGQ